MSPPTKQKYEYAVINKNRKNASQVTVTPEISADAHSSPVTVKRGMTIELPSPETPVNSNVLFVTSPVGETTSLSKTPSMDSEPVIEMTSGKRYIVETNLDETPSTASTDNLKPSGSAAFYDSMSDEEDKLEDYRKLMSRIGILEQQLKTSGIDIDQYSHENFTSSQDLLAVSFIY